MSPAGPEPYAPAADGMAAATPTSQFDTGFVIAEIQAAHVRAPGPDYWQGTAGAVRDGSAERFHFSPPWRTVYARTVESVLLRVRLTDGSVGWGEATCPIAPEVICTLAKGFVSEITAGHHFASVDALVDHLYDAQRCRGYLAGHLQDAAAALDIALHDALARRAGCPVRSLLSPVARACVPAYLSGARAPDRAGRIDAVRRWADAGATAVKLFLRGDATSDLAEFDELRHAVPEIDWWAVDALWTCEHLEQAVQARQAHGERGARWLECPLLPEDLPGHVALQAAPGCPIALGEHFRTALQARAWLDAGALQVLQPDIGRTGFVQARRMLAAARQVGIAVTPHMGGALDVMQAATLQFATVATPEVPCEYQAGLAKRLAPALRTHWRLGPRGFEAPTEAGLGIDVDADALQPFVVG